MGVSDCENFRFEYRVVVTLLECTEFVMLCLDTTWYLLGVGVTAWGPMILTDAVPVGGTLCEVVVFCYNKFGSGGYLWLSNSYTVTVALLWGFLFQIVYSCTGSYTGLICKMNGYLCRNEISLAGQL